MSIWGSCSFKAPRSADVEALTDVRLLTIGRSAYLRLIAQTGIAEQMHRCSKPG